MRTKQTQTFEALSALTARFEELVQKQPAPTISKAHQGRIADKFAKKSLQELSDLVHQMKSSTIPSCPE